ncbi:hypothetical protein SDRG_14665 [Saprolegnia diclina VS20]|uniref:Profilin n=1 Tax=Saprolegnia diclina (strain VS20) TaxID=1156394 RepID=T0Q2J1_SAPDV|nr:hypothetical protein SDRG_14665 [Saprolegnia diclina VS20]EQC27615.1 hypothetical protein SDRG_14665 [Saprolegnia diclina VS20]|eukprot:XP_008619035.1 hypothetical protein SDRG_14665 [Saprolegnia diclina VS20]
MAAVPPETDVVGLVDAMKAQKEWTKAIVFDHEGNFIAGTVKPLDGEISAYLRLYDDRDTTMGTGIVFLNEQYDVHRFHPPLIYGRKGDPAKEEGEGIALCKVEKKVPVYCMITYVFPTLSARVVPQLQAFCAQHLAQ